VSNLESPLIDLEPHEWRRIFKRIYEQPIYWGNLAFFLFACGLAFGMGWVFTYHLEPWLDSILPR